MTAKIQSAESETFTIGAMANDLNTNLGIATSFRVAQKSLSLSLPSIGFLISH